MGVKIDELGPPDAEHSTGLILRWRDRLLFALEPHRQWRPGPGAELARFVGIGGHLEPGESWSEAVCREAMEEAGLAVTLVAPQATYLLRDDGTVSDISQVLDWPDPVLPYFIWSARFTFGRPPDERTRHFVNAVFLAVVPDDARPQAAAEMPAIVALSEAQLRRAARRPLALEELLAHGALLWEAAAVPRSTLLAPGGSAQWYAALLAR